MGAIDLLVMTTLYCPLLSDSNKIFHTRMVLSYMVLASALFLLSTQVKACTCFGKTVCAAEPAKEPAKGKEDTPVDKPKTG